MPGGMHEPYGMQPQAPYHQQYQQQQQQQQQQQLPPAPPPLPLQQNYGTASQVRRPIVIRVYCKTDFGSDSGSDSGSHYGSDPGSEYGSDYWSDSEYSSTKLDAAWVEACCAR
jgi:hypothetical protein